MMNTRKHVDWRMSSNGRALSRRADTPFNDTLHPALLDDSRMSAKFSRAVNFQYDAQGAAVYVCAVISVYALFVVLFVVILFAVRRRRHAKSRLNAEAGSGERVGRLASSSVNSSRLHDVSVRIPPPPQPPPPQPTRLRSDSSSSVSPVRRSSRARRSRSVAVAAGSAANRSRWRVSELLVQPSGRSTNDTQSRRAVSASPIDDVITLIQVICTMYYQPIKQS